MVNFLIFFICFSVVFNSLFFVVFVVFISFNGFRDGLVLLFGILIFFCIFFWGFCLELEVLFVNFCELLFMIIFGFFFFKNWLRSCLFFVLFFDLFVILVNKCYFFFLGKVLILILYLFWKWLFSLYGLLWNKFLGLWIWVVK